MLVSHLEGKGRPSLRAHTQSYLEQMKWIASFSSFASRFGRSLFRASPTSQQQFVAPRHFTFSDRQLRVFPGSLPKLCWSKTYWEGENYFFKISVRLLLVMLSEKASLEEVLEWGETRCMLYPFQKGFLLWTPKFLLSWSQAGNILDWVFLFGNTLETSNAYTAQQSWLGLVQGPSAGPNPSVFLPFFMNLARIVTLQCSPWTVPVSYRSDQEQNQLMGPRFRNRRGNQCANRTGVFHSQPLLKLVSASWLITARMLSGIVLVATGYR